MSVEDFRRRRDNGEISVADFDKSWKPRECIAKYRAKEGKVPPYCSIRHQDLPLLSRGSAPAGRMALQIETDMMTERALAQPDILFTTASNCGGPMLEKSRSFVRTCIFCGEAGQRSIPSLCVPLDSWEGFFLIGDMQQLEPTA